jgi:hypothetical protein
MARRFGRSHFGLHGHRFRLGGRRLARFGRHRRWFRRRPASPVAMPSPLITWAQGCLAQVLGTEVPQDGLMGPETRQAIQQFQTQQQSPPTGILDSDTVNALQAACSGQQAAQDTAAPPPPSSPPPRQPAPPAGSPAAPRQDGGGRHGRQQATELEEGELALAGGAPREQSGGGRWIRRRGGIILLGA